MAFKEVTSLDCDVVVALGGFDKNDKPNPKTIEGYYLGKREVKGDQGTSTIHVFQTPKGNVGLWGAADSNSKLSGVVLGTMVQVEFKEKKKLTGGKTKKIYTVRHDPDNTIEVAAQAEDAQDFGSTSEDIENADAGGGYEEETVEEVEETPAPQVQAKSAAERKAAVQALLNRKK